MAKNYTADELNNLRKESMIALVLAMQAQMETLNANMERLIEQIAVANNQRYCRSSEKMEVIDGQLSLDFIFNEAEALTETLYVVEPTEEDVIPTKKKKQDGTSGGYESRFYERPTTMVRETFGYLPG